MKTSVANKSLPGLALIVAASLIIGAFATFGVTKIFPDHPLFETESDTRHTQIVNSITREEQIVLLSLGIQGISEKNEKSQFFGMDIPGSGRAMFVQYAFNAKLGIEGKGVEVLKVGEKDYLVMIPEFIFIGHDDETFRLVAEDNGALSWVTPKIDAFEAVNSILNDDAQEEYLDSNRETLEDQAKVFYTSIFSSIDPTVTMRFEFRQERR